MASLRTSQREELYRLQSEPRDAGARSAVPSDVEGAGCAPAVDRGFAGAPSARRIGHRAFSPGLQPGGLEVAAASFTCGALWAAVSLVKRPPVDNLPLDSTARTAIEQWRMPDESTVRKRVWIYPDGSTALHESWPA